MDDECRASLKSLFERAHYLADPLAALGDPFVSGGIFGVASGGALQFVGDDYALLLECGRLVAKPALSGDGLSAEAALRLVVDACNEARLGTVDDGIQVVEDAQLLPSSEWLVMVKSIDALRGQPTSFLIGEVERTTTAPAAWVPFADRGPRTALDISPPLYSVLVEARDAGSARILGLDRIEEARGVLALTHVGRLDRVGRSTILLDVAKGQPLYAGTSGPNIYAENGVGASGQWEPGFLELSTSLAKPRGKRSEWETRCASAARWIHLAQLTTWHTQALVDCMNALEALCIPARAPGGKGSVIAEKVSSLHFPDGRTPMEQQAWLGNLYQRRNDAVHEGTDFEDDLEVERLILFAAATARWAVGHLDPVHSPGGGCTTLIGVWDQSIHTP